MALNQIGLISDLIYEKKVVGHNSESHLLFFLSFMV